MIQKTLIFLLLFTASIINGQDLPEIDLDFSSYSITYDGKLLGYYGEKKRIEIKSTSNLSPHIIKCLIATEDREFYNHDGVSVKGLVRGLLKTITGSTQGGSTITMQLARNLFLTHERTISRKVSEIDLSYRLEEKFTKNEILILYLNTVYFGNGAWGIWAASQEYFSKSPDELSLTESAALVGLLQSPARYSKDHSKMLNRRNEVLYNLVETGKLSEREYRKYKKEPLGLSLRENTGRHFAEHVRREAVSILKQKGMSLSKDQLKITTTINYDIQKAAEDAVFSQWKEFPQHLKEVQVGLVSVEPGTGMIKAMVGGNPESETRGLNHTTQIKRQPGSSFKPFLYGSLLNRGFTLAAPLLDSPLVVDRGKPWEWRPTNSNNSYSGKELPMINAVQNSINLAAARAITQLTEPDSVIEFARSLGIESEIPSYPSIALGTGEVSPLEMAASYSVFASSGIYVKPFSIIKIEDKNGRIIYHNQNYSDYVIDSATAFLMTQALETVVDSGTARSVRRYYKGPAAGKTGTTQNSTDAWFVGYTPNLSTAIWVGYDNPNKKLSSGFEYGGAACAPVWGKMMASISRKYSRDFIKPLTVEDVELCLESGELSTEFCTIKNYYPVNTEKMPPKCSLHFKYEEKVDIHYGW